MADDDKIRKLWERMEKDLEEKDPDDDWPPKGIVMCSPWTLQVHAYLYPEDGTEEHETLLHFVRREAVRPEDFDEASLPPELLEIVKAESCDESSYPNAVFAETSGDTLEEAIAKMRLKLRLLDYGYILMDEYYYKENILDEDNGGWMLDDDYDLSFLDEEDGDKLVIRFDDDDDDCDDGDGRDD